MKEGKKRDNRQDRTANVRVQEAHDVGNLASEQEQLNSWLSDERSNERDSDDVRNRIALAGGSISRGVFGRSYLLASDDRLTVSDCSPEQALVNTRQIAANDSEFDPVLHGSDNQ